MGAEGAPGAVRVLSAGFRLSGRTEARRAKIEARAAERMAHVEARKARGRGPPWGVPSGRESLSSRDGLNNEAMTEKNGTDSESVGCTADRESVGNLTGQQTFRSKIELEHSMVPQSVPR